MGLFGNSPKAGGFMDVIRCDEPSYLIWKWHPNGSQKGNNNRENAIRWGSSLRVKDGEVAVFVYSQADGTKQDFIMGPQDIVLDTDNLPILASIVGLAYAGGTPFQAEVYFINLAEVVQIRFAVPYFDLFDPRFLDFAVPIAVRGTITFKITDFHTFIKKHRLIDFDLDSFKQETRDAIVRYVKNEVANAPEKYGIPVIQIERKNEEICQNVKPALKARLSEDFGVDLKDIDIAAIEIDKSSDGYRQLMAVTKDLTSATIKAKTDAEIRNIYDKQRIEMQNLEETMRIQREEGQYAQHKQTQTANFAAYQTEAQTEVGVAGANALGQMGANGAGGVDLGNGGGFNPAAMMAGMAVGGAVGQNIAGTMNSMMNGNGTSGMGSPMTPPPVPEISYHVVINGQAAGPFDKTVLGQMITNGQFTTESLVWKPGMAQWTTAGTLSDLQPLFTQFTMPPIN